MKARNRGSLTWEAKFLRYAQAIEDAINGDWIGVDRACKELSEDRAWCDAHAATTCLPELARDGLKIMCKLASVSEHEGYAPS